jgi:transcriptional regulator with XRE-family HTH domain
MVIDRPSEITAENLRECRKAAGLTQAGVGNLIGLEKEVVCRIETGVRPLQTAEAMVLSAALLGREIPKIGEV